MQSRSDASPRAIVAWEGTPDAADAQQISAIAALGENLATVTAGIMIPVSLLVTAQADVMDLLVRFDWRVLPLFDLRMNAGPRHLSAGVQAEALATFAAARRIYEHCEVRYAVAAINDNRPDVSAIAAARAALSPNDARTSIGWIRRTSAYGVRPPALDYVLDLPPYGDVPSGTAGTHRYSYSVLVSELARRHAGDDSVVPSVLWSPRRETRLADSDWEVGDISPMKIAYAVDTARRFVGNRAAMGAPFWILRAAFDPAQAGDTRALHGLADLLQQPHIPSAVAGHVAEASSTRSSGARIAVVIHLYYPDLWDEMADTLANLPERFDLFVSCPFRLASALRTRVRLRFPDAAVVGVQNLGRDVLPFLLWLRTVGATNYQYVLKLHGKKSVHILDGAQGPFADGEMWRRQAQDGLVGEPEHARAIVESLDRQPQIGMVAPSGQLYDQVEWRCGTTDLVSTVLARMEAPRTVAGVFAAGTMFWARMSALAPLAQLPDAALDFDREAGQVDGTLHHAYERLMALVAVDGGFAVTESKALLATRGPSPAGPA
jgi:Rhamnan synthesis protein F